MTRLGPAAIAAAALLAAAFAGLAWLGAPAPERVSEGAPAAPAAGNRAVVPKDGAPKLYCEFTNFADRTPLVGFYFRIEAARTPPAYALLFQREQDGSQDDFGGEAAPRPRWAFDGSDNPAVIRAPDETTTINLYDYDPGRPGTVWFEAGLRSIRYRNLGGRCRHSAA